MAGAGTTKLLKIINKRCAQGAEQPRPHQALRGSEMKPQQPCGAGKVIGFALWTWLLNITAYVQHRYHGMICV